MQRPRMELLIEKRTQLSYFFSPDHWMGEWPWLCVCDFLLLFTFLFLFPWSDSISTGFSGNKVAKWEEVRIRIRSTDRSQELEHISCVTWASLLSLKNEGDGIRHSVCWLCVSNEIVYEKMPCKTEGIEQILLATPSQLAMENHSTNLTAMGFLGPSFRIAIF